MNSRLALALLRFGPTRWVWAIAVTLYALVRSLPAHIGYNVQALTPRKRPASEIRRMGRAFGTRLRRAQRRVRNDRVSKLMQLRAERYAIARALYIRALQDLADRGEAVTEMRRAEARAIANLPAHELRKGWQWLIPPVLQPIGRAA